MSGGLGVMIGHQQIYLGKNDFYFSSPTSQSSQGSILTSALRQHFNLI
jgi:hypothetical protein